MEGDGAAELDFRRPKNYAECEREGLGAPDHPCPFIGCKHHLYLDADGPNDAEARIIWPELEVWELDRTCAFWVGLNENATLDDVGGMLRVSRERIRQIEARAQFKLRDDEDVEQLHEDHLSREVTKHIESEENDAFRVRSLNAKLRSGLRKLGEPANSYARQTPAEAAENKKIREEAAARIPQLLESWGSLAKLSAVSRLPPQIIRSIQKGTGAVTNASARKLLAAPLRPQNEVVDSKTDKAAAPLLAIRGARALEYLLKRLGSLGSIQTRTDLSIQALVAVRENRGGHSACGVLIEVETAERAAESSALVVSAKQEPKAEPTRSEKSVVADALQQSIVVESKPVNDSIPEELREIDAIYREHPASQLKRLAKEAVDRLKQRHSTFAAIDRAAGAGVSSAYSVQRGTAGYITCLRMLRADAQPVAPKAEPTTSHVDDAYAAIEKLKSVIGSYRGIASHVGISEKTVYHLRYTRSISKKDAALLIEAAGKIVEGKVEPTNKTQPRPSDAAFFPKAIPAELMDTHARYMSMPPEEVRKAASKAVDRLVSLYGGQEPTARAIDLTFTTLRNVKSGVAGAISCLKALKANDSTPDDHPIVTKERIRQDAIAALDLAKRMFGSYREVSIVTGIGEHLFKRLKHTSNIGPERCARILEKCREATNARLNAGAKVHVEQPILASPDPEPTVAPSIDLSDLDVLIQRENAEAAKSALTTKAVEQRGIPVSVSAEYTRMPMIELREKSIAALNILKERLGTDAAVAARLGLNKKTLHNIRASCAGRVPCIAVLCAAREGSIDFGKPLEPISDEELSEYIGKAGPPSRSTFAPKAVCQEALDLLVKLRILFKTYDGVAERTGFTSSQLHNMYYRGGATEEFCARFIDAGKKLLVDTADELDKHALQRWHAREVDRGHKPVKDVTLKVTMSRREADLLYGKLSIFYDLSPIAKALKQAITESEAVDDPN